MGTEARRAILAVPDKGLERLRRGSAARALFCAVMIGLVMGGGRTAHAQSPVFVEAEPAMVDFGDVRPGETVTREVELRNVANFPVIVRSLRPSCECTVAELLEGREITPGQSVTLTMSFDAEDRYGLVEPNLVIVFSGRVPALRIEGRAHVNSGIRFEWLDGSREALRLQSVTGAAFRVVSVNGREAIGRESDVSAPEHVVRVDGGRGAEESGIPGADRWVVVETDDEAAPVIVTPAQDAERSGGPRSWTVARGLHVLGRVVPGESAGFETLLLGLRGSEFNAIDEIEVESLRCEAGLIGLERTGAGIRARFYLRPDEGARGLVGATIRVTAQGTEQAIEAYGAAPR